MSKTNLDTTWSFSYKFREWRQRFSQQKEKSRRTIKMARMTGSPHLPRKLFDGERGKTLKHGRVPELFLLRRVTFTGFCVNEPDSRKKETKSVGWWVIPCLLNRQVLRSQTHKRSCPTESAGSSCTSQAPVCALVPRSLRGGFRLPSPPFSLKKYTGCVP